MQVISFLSDKWMSDFGERTISTWWVGCIVASYIHRVGNASFKELRTDLREFAERSAPRRDPDTVLKDALKRLRYRDLVSFSPTHGWSLTRRAIS